MPKSKTNGLATARGFIFQTMLDLKAGKISIDEALVQNKLASQLMEGYRIEVKAVEIATFASKGKLEYEDATLLLKQ